MDGFAIDRPYRDCVRIDERTLAVVEVDLMPAEILEDSHTFVGRDVLLVDHEIADGEVFFDRDVEPGEVAIAKSGEIKRGFAKRLRRERSRVGRSASDGRLTFDHGDGLTEVCRLGRRFLARRAGPDHYQVVRFCVHVRDNPQRVQPAPCFSRL